MAKAQASRPDALDRCGIPARASFERLYVLARPTEPTGAAETVQTGLHAKIYVWDRRRRTRIAIGSSNATSAALEGRNIEVVLEFDCTAAMKGGVKSLLETTQLSKVLMEYGPRQPTETPDPTIDTRLARRLLIDGISCLKCTASAEGYLVALQPTGPIDAAVARDLLDLRFWPATCDATVHAPCLDALLQGRPPRILGLSRSKKLPGSLASRPARRAARRPSR
jgi:hypothetical protein